MVEHVLKISPTRYLAIGSEKLREFDISTCHFVAFPVMMYTFVKSHSFRTLHAHKLMFGVNKIYAVTISGWEVRCCYMFVTFESLFCQTPFFHSFVPFKEVKAT